ncbi:hypothetical protein KMZ68_25740 [Bradyrhizobium sediminis]|uniref:Uncharacterized protein n=1 Tax=Bradyrhizobium sediminis TaxID=2840469 RepID=A0A975NND2_9BRAD|nr:hypothetical protein [Bradyrhizobium sediminis]QWG18292.1 hypothetical protein KMZ68_25740 [Bradyrhizobium sediminis]
MLEFVEELWRRGVRFDAGSGEGSAQFWASRLPWQAKHPAADSQPESSHPSKLSGTPGDGLYNNICATTSGQGSLADRKTTLEALVRGNLKIDGFPIFSEGEATAFVENVRGCGSDQALRELVDILAGKCGLLESALLQGMRANANLV